MKPPVSQKTAILVWESRTGTARTLSRRAAVLLEHRGWTVRMVAAKSADPQALQAADLVLFGTFCAANRPAAETRKLWDLPLVLNQAAAFVTHATFETGPYYEEWAAGCHREFEEFAARSAQRQAGYYHCRGRASLPIRLFVRTVVFRGGRDWPAWNRTSRDQPSPDALDRFDEFVEGLA